MADKNGVIVYPVTLKMERLQAAGHSDMVAGIIGNKDLALAETIHIADSKADGNASMTLGPIAEKTTLDLKQLREAGAKERQETDLKKAELELQMKQVELKTKQVELETKQKELEILQAQIRLKEMEKK